ncbi:MAG: hypothetical protein Q9227_002443 [Pyrenula ochraceoflavens]
MGSSLPSVQTVALVRKLGGPVEFVEDYPIPEPKRNEVLAEILYTGVCQSDLHTKQGTAAGPDGQPITRIKLPHVGGHEGIGRIVRLGPGVGDQDVAIGRYVGIRFSSRICRRCEWCLAGTEQYCPRATNHLHHEDGSFQQFIALDADYLTVLPDDIDPKVMGPVLSFVRLMNIKQAVKNTGLKPGDWVAVVGAGGGLGHFAVQYAKAHGARVIAIDKGAEKEEYVKSLGAEKFIDFGVSKGVASDVCTITSGGAQAVVITAGNPNAFVDAADMLKTGGIISCVGIPPGKTYIEAPVSQIVIKGLRITGNLVGSLKECLEAVDMVRSGAVKPHVRILPFKDLPKVYEELENFEVAGRVVLQIARE